MKLTRSDLQGLAEIAISAAEDASEMIAASRPKEIQRKGENGSLASQVVTEVDRQSEALILEHLEPTRERFGLGLLTEERTDDESRFAADYFWCIDPLDGTLPFTEGRPGYAVSIALIARTGVPLIGVVSDPAEATLMHAIAGSGVFRNQRPWPKEEQRAKVLSVFADRSFLRSDQRVQVLSELDRIARQLDLDDVHLHVGAGAVLNACGALGRAPGCYFKFPRPSGGGNLWDFAATACLFREVGAIASDIRGNPLDLNRRDCTSLNHRGTLFATDERLAQSLRSLYSRIA